MLYESSEFRLTDFVGKEGISVVRLHLYSRNTDLHSSDDINVHENRPKEGSVKENGTWTTLVETKNDVDRMSGAIEKLQPGLKRGLVDPGRGWGKGGGM